MKFIDTNILLSQLKSLEKEEHFLLSSITIEELEDIKTSGKKTEDVRYSARAATRWLNEHQGKYTVIVYDFEVARQSSNILLPESHDTMIMACCKYAINELQYDDVVFVTNDVLAKLIAESYFQLPVESFVGKDEIYKGYKTIKGNTDIINEYMNKCDYSDWSANEYLIIENTDDNTIKEMRFDGTKFVTLKLPPSKFIKGKNSLQRCALDALANPDITICAILGTYGSGKTFLSMQMALYAVQEKGTQSKILGVREVLGEGKDVGYLPGTLEEKVCNFFAPLSQSLKGGEFELEHLKQNGVLETMVPVFMKGTTYNETCIVVDEAEDLKESQIRLVGTRIGENSKIYFAGDYKQSVINKSTNNALIKMCNEFRGNPRFACVCLDEDVRSETSKMFAELFT